MVYLVRYGVIIPTSKCKKCKKVYCISTDGIYEKRRPIKDFESEFIILKAETREDADKELQSIQREAENSLLSKIDNIVTEKDFTHLNDNFINAERNYYVDEDIEFETPIVSILSLQACIRIFHTSFCDTIYCDDMRKYFSNGPFYELLVRVVDVLNKKYLNDPNAIHLTGRYSNSGKNAYVSLKEFEFETIPDDSVEFNDAVLVFKSKDNRVRWYISSSIYKRQLVVDDSSFDSNSGTFRFPVSYSNLKKYNFDASKAVKDFYNGVHNINFNVENEERLNFLYCRADDRNAYIYKRKVRGNGTVKMEAITLPREFYQKAIDIYKKTAQIKLEFYKYAIYCDLDSFTEMFMIKNGRLVLIPEADYWSNYSVLEGIDDLRNIDDLLMKDLIKSLKKQLGEELFDSIVLIGELGD